MLFAMLKEEGKRHCLNCPNVLVGGLHDDELGSMFVCRQDSCVYEKESIDMGRCGDEHVKLRLLKGA